MAWFHNLNFRKVFGLCNDWVILRTAAEYQCIAQMCKDADVMGPPENKEGYPCLAKFWQDECVEEPYLNATFVGVFAARELLLAHGFKVELSEEGKRQRDAEGW